MTASLPGNSKQPAVGQKAFIAAICSKRRISTVWVCVFDGQHWNLTEMLSADTGTRQELGPSLSQSITYTIPFGITCQACGIRIKGGLYAAWVCFDCETPNCLGFHRIVDGKAQLQCGRCEASFTVIPSSKEFTGRAVTEANKDRPALTRSNTPAAIPSKADILRLLSS